MQHKTLTSTIGIALALATSPALAQERDDRATLEAQIEALETRDAQSQQRIEALERRLQLLESQLGMASIGDVEGAQLRGRGVGGIAITAQAQPQQEQPPAASPSQAEEPDRRAPAPSEAVETVARAEQGNYGARFSLEPGLTYSHTTSAALNLSGFLALDAIFLGRLSIDEIDTDIVTADVSARYGITDRLQVDTNIPFIMRRSTYTSGGAGGSATGLSKAARTKAGLGDISIGASYRLFEETARSPDIVLSARVKAPTGDHPFGVPLVEVDGSSGNLNIPEELPTGTGVWGASVGLSALKTIDPLVVFGNASFFYNFEQEFDDLDEIEGDQPGTADLGWAVQVGAGLAIALNDTSSLALSYTQRFVEESRIRGVDDEAFEPIIGSGAMVGLLNIGASFAINEDIALLANVSAGVTDDAPDMQVGIRVPIRF